MRIDAKLLVSLKGTDLVAETANIALRRRLGQGDNLIGLKRFDYFAFSLTLPAGVSAEATTAALKSVLDRQSTFYNRNKHVYTLECSWEGGTHLDGVSREDQVSRWVNHLAAASATSKDENSRGKLDSDSVTFSLAKGYVVDVLVEDDDPATRTAIAQRLRTGLAASGISDTTVECQHRATLWWLALHQENADAAKRLAEQISTTTRRDSGLLCNPNYQRAEFVSVQPLK